MKELGSFSCRSGSLWVTDPCYIPGTWCQGKIGNALEGKWKAKVYSKTMSGWGTRNSILLVVHEDAKKVTLRSPEFFRQGFTVGVDSGQAGFFDGDVAIGSGQYGETGTFYDDCCQITVNNPDQAGIVGGTGVVSSSGCGDGSYICDVITRDNKVVAAKITFL